MKLIVTEVKSQPKKRGRQPRNTDRKENKVTSWNYKAPDFFYERLSPKSRAFLDHLGMELLEWDTKMKPLILSKFFCEREHPLVMADVYEWAEEKMVKDSRRR